MDKPALIIELPELNNETIVDIHHFLQLLMIAFESHYILQLRQYRRDLPFDDDIDDLF